MKGKAFFKHHQLKNERGAALLNVMLIVTFVMVLASSISSMALSSYQMKMVNLNSKDNFYSCEAMLEQIKVGFQNEMIHQKGGTDAETFKNFYAAYKESDPVPGVAGADAFCYDIKKIYERLITNIHGDEVMFVGEDHREHSTIGDEEQEYHAAVTFSPKSNERIQVTLQSGGVKYGDINFVLTDTYVLFKNLTVIYVENGYESRITTDIRIAFPEGGMVVEKDSKVKICDYAIISYGGLQHEEIAWNDTNVAINGNVYLENTDTNALYINNEPWSIYDNGIANILISGKHNTMIGDVYVGQNSKLIFAENAKIIIDGDLYIAPSGEIVVPSSSTLYISGNVTGTTGNLEYEKLTEDMAAGEKLQLIDILQDEAIERQLDYSNSLIDEVNGSSTWAVGLRNPAFYAMGYEDESGALPIDNGKKVHIHLCGAGSIEQTSDLQIWLMNLVTDEAAKKIGRSNYKYYDCVKLNSTQINGLIVANSRFALKGDESDIKFESMTQEEFKSVLDLNMPIAKSGITPSLDGTLPTSYIILPVKYLFKEGILLGTGNENTDTEGGNTPEAGGISGSSSSVGSAVISYSNWRKE